MTLKANHPLPRDSRTSKPLSEGPDVNPLLKLPKSVLLLMSRTSLMTTFPALEQFVASGSRVAVGRIALAGICLVLAACGGRTDTPPPAGAVSQSVAPTITQQPASVSVTAGQAAVFSVSASGTAPLAYQWRRNGVDIVGATATTYTIAAAALADSGAVFQIVVTNSAGSATSNAAALAVTANAAAIGTKQFGTPADELAYGIATDAQGNFYATGVTTGSLDGTTAANFAGDLFVVKYDRAGVRQWVRQLGTPNGNTKAVGIAIDPQGNVYVAGSTSGDLDGNFNAGVVGNFDLFVVKYNGAGVKQWTRQLGTPGDDFASGIAADAQGNVYVTGSTSGGLDGNANAGLSGIDMFIVKYDGAGTRQWTRQFGAAGDDEGVGIAIDAQGNVYVAGSTRDGVLDGNINAGGFDLFVVKYDAVGTRQWTRVLGSPAPDRAMAIATDALSNVFVTGYTSGGLDGNPAAGSLDLFVVKYDAAGTRQWTRQLGTPVDEIATGIAADAQGNVYVSGHTMGMLDGNPNAGGIDSFIVKYDGAGIKQWTREFGTTMDDIATGIATDAQGNVYVTGRTGGSLDGNTNAGGDDFFVVKYDSAGVKQ